MSFFRDYIANEKRIEKLAKAVESALGITLYESAGGSQYAVYEVGTRYAVKVRVADHGNQSTLGHRNEAQANFVAAKGKRPPQREVIRAIVARCLCDLRQEMQAGV